MTQVYDLDRIDHAASVRNASWCEGAERWVLYSLGMAIFFTVVTLAASIFEDRLLNGIDLWIKPLKFSVSVVIHSLTLWIAIRMLPRTAKNSVGVERAMLIYCFCGTAELIYIVLQAARGRHSHFNYETTVETFLYMAVMGPMALAMVICSWWVGRAMWKDRSSRDQENNCRNRGLYDGLSLGLMVGAIGTAIVASVMSSGQVAGPGHWVGGEKTDAGGLPFFGWSTSGGDLRVAHFFSNHAPQIVMMVGWLSDRFSKRAGRKWIFASAAVASLLILGTFVQALLGYPLLTW